MDIYWELSINQVYEWLNIRNGPLEIDNRIPYLPNEDIESINKIIDKFRTKRAGTNDGGPVIYLSINSEEDVGRVRSGYCWFLENPHVEIELMIHKFSDDWYLVRWISDPGWNVENRWFVCDEIEGVKKLIINLLDI